MHKKLAIKFRQYILEQEDEVQMQYLIDRASGKGHDMQLILQALQTLHRYKDIKKTVRNDTVFYYKQLPKYKQDELDDVFLRQLHKDIQEDWDKQCEYFETHYSKEHKDMVRDIFKNVGVMVKIGKSLVPASNEEYYKKVLYTKGNGNNSRRKNTKRNN